MTRADLQATLDFAVAIAREAGRSTLAHFRSPGLRAETKADGSPVTAADRAAERTLRERIRTRHPDDGILGEEDGETRGSSGRTWILDPIDGTVAFVRGVPLFGTLVGLEERGEPVLGVIFHAALDEIVYGAQGLGAFWRVGSAPAREARVSTTRDLSGALLVTTEVRGFHAAGLASAHGRLVRATGFDRGYSDCYAFTLLATGRCDLVVEPRMSVWDNAALLPILEEAGGRFTDFAGARSIRGGNALGSNGWLHEAALSLIRADQDGASR